MDAVLVEEMPITLLFKEMAELLTQISKYEEDVSTDAFNSLKSTLNDALNAKNLWLALKLEKMFGCTDNNLDILKLCYNLAEGSILPYQLSTEQRLLITNGTHYRRFSHRRAFLSARLSSSSKQIISLCIRQPIFNC